MGRALEVINTAVVNPGAGPTAVTANAGDSLSVRSADINSKIRLLQAWAFTTTNLLMRVRSPRLHDQAQNARLQPRASSPDPLWPWMGDDQLFSQDNLIVELGGGAAETDLAALLVYYDNLPGINARLHSPAEIDPLIEHITVVEVDLTTAATAGAYSATVALNGTFDTLERGRDYAILGYECATTAGSIGLRGADTGNLRVGGPLINLPFLTEGWFVKLSNEYGYPCIPVFNAANVGAILCDCTAQATAASVKVGFNLALLKQGSNLS